MSPDTPRELPSDPPAPVELLSTVDTWLFDMDNCLYPASANLFQQVDTRMRHYIMRLFDLDSAAAHQMQKQYFHSFGTTLSGLMREHGVDPYAFLDYVHDLDFSVLTPDPRLRAALLALPGRRIVFTNGDRKYATRVLGKLGILDAFVAIHDIHAMAYEPKPHAPSYDGIIATFGLDARRTFFADDMAHNLPPARARGMTTLWVNNGSERGAHGYQKQAISHETADLGRWLADLTRPTSAQAPSESAPPPAPAPR